MLRARSIRVSSAPLIQKGRLVHPDEPFAQELLNRLAAIQAAAEILDDNNDLSPDERHAFFTAIRTEAGRLRQMIAE